MIFGLIYYPKKLGVNLNAMSVNIFNQCDTLKLFWYFRLIPFQVFSNFLIGLMLQALAVLPRNYRELFTFMNIKQKVDEAIPKKAGHND